MKKLLSHILLFMVFATLKLKVILARLDLKILAQLHCIPTCNPQEPSVAQINSLTSYNTIFNGDKKEIFWMCQLIVLNVMNVWAGLVTHKYFRGQQLST